MFREIDEGKRTFFLNSLFGIAVLFHSVLTNDVI